MLICLSGSYVGQELGLHFGHLPPSFLPVGASRLFNMQFEKMGRGEACLLSIPEDFSLDDLDQEVLSNSGVMVLRTKRDLGLCAAVRAVLDEVDPSETVRILFGDTLVDLDMADSRSMDFVVVKETTVDYPWVYAQEVDGETSFVSESPSAFKNQKAVCGYFEFSDLELLQKAFSEETLEAALNVYSAERPLNLVEARQWYDFGHLTLFYKSKRELLVARSFNNLRSDGYSIVKTSEQTQRIRAESVWYETLPHDVILHTPRYIGRLHEDFKAGYQLEYLHSPTLSELSCFGRLSLSSWTLIFSQCFRLLQKFSNILPPSAAPEAAPDFSKYFYEDIFIDKTWSRITSFCEEAGISSDAAFVLNGHRLPPLSEVVVKILGEIPPTKGTDICFWHGDFFFGNLFFDFNTQRVMMVDPRGQLSDGNLSQFGDYRYDLGKLAHSVLGGYDQIISGRSRLRQFTQLDIEFSVEGYDERGQSQLSQLFLDLGESSYGLSETTLRALAAVMFFSMLPLHRDSTNRQMRLLASGLNQYLLMNG